MIGTASALDYWTTWNPFTNNFDYYALYGSSDNLTAQCMNLSGTQQCSWPGTSTFNSTYHNTSLDVTANRTDFLKCYNASYESMYNSSYLTGEPLWQGNSTLVRYKSEELNWSNLTGYPTACPAGTWVSQLDDAVTCSAPVASDIDPGTFPAGNYVFQQNVTAAEFLGKTSCTNFYNGSDADFCADSSYNSSYLTTSYNSTYHTTSLVVAGNYSNWATTYNATYASTSDVVAANYSNWATTYNITYAATSADVTANRSDFLTKCYNSTYESMYNASYLTAEVDPRWQGNSTLIPYLASNNTFTGNMTINSNSNLNVTGNLNVGGNLNVVGNLTLGGNLNVNGTILLQANMKVAWVNSSIFMTYNSTTNNITISNQA